MLQHEGAGEPNCKQVRVDRGFDRGARRELNRPRTKAEEQFGGMSRVRLRCSAL